jgi:hypothetical protein
MRTLSFPIGIRSLVLTSRHNMQRHIYTLVEDNKDEVITRTTIIILIAHTEEEKRESSNKKRLTRRC